jgi:hypothetical protein
MTTKKKDKFSAIEERAARAERIEVQEAEPYGWMAKSEADEEQMYHLFLDPQSRKLVCTCADFVYRGDAEPGYECKHIAATLKFVGRQYLKHEYDAQEQNKRLAKSKNRT